MTTHSQKALWLVLATLCSACERNTRRPAADSTARRPITVSQRSAQKPDSLSSNLGRVARRPQRFGLIHIERAGAPCMTIEADSLPAGTPIRFVSLDLTALGAPNELTPEEDFVIGTFATQDDWCLGKTLGESAKGLRAEAARREPASALFTYFATPDRPRRGSENAAAAELHRRFEHRGEFYRM